VKTNILRLLVEVGFRVTVVPAGTSATSIMALRPDGLFLSNGPGDPATLDYVVNPVKEILGKVPMFGICLGHQILGQALGGKTYKLKFGHRGGNHPVRDETTGKVEITVQNHGFAVEKEQLSKSVGITHINLNDGTVEGLASKEARAFSVQYHPEASPGPHDSKYLFERFFNLVVGAEARK
jgi:carbamoyl-phosphate synthase small subunit